MIDETYDAYEMAEIEQATWEQTQELDTAPAADVDDTDAPF